MKARHIGACVCLIAISMCVAVSAHPGRTDSNGGHYNRSTGEYHYHHGYPEHQHTNGVCPYDYDDKTGEGSGGNSDGGTSGKNGTNVIELTPTIIPTAIPVSTVSPTPEPSLIDRLIDRYPILFIVFILLSIAISWVLFFAGLLVLQGIASGLSWIWNTLIEFFKWLFKH